MVLLAETFDSISVLPALTMTTDWVAETFANSNIGPRPDSLESVNSSSYMFDVNERAIDSEMVGFFELAIDPPLTH